MIPKDFNLEGKTAVVCGAGRSWLESVASCLAEAGADVALAGQDQERMEKAAQEVKGFGRQIMITPTDVTSYQDAEKMVSDVVSQWGKVDILVNSFDIQLAKPLLETTIDEWQKVLTTNLEAVFTCTKAVAGHMLDRKEGKVINITSGLGERGLPNNTAYCAAAGGVGQFTRALALEWARENIQVNAVGVGWMTEAEGGEVGDDDPLAPHAPLLVRYIPLRRLGHGEDIKGAIIYLASNASVYTTGQLLYVTGGVMAHG